MKCRKGIKVEGRRVPCGQCISCRVNKGREWTSRILLEAAVSPELPYFVTLTYSDEHVPVTPDGDQTLDKKSILKWVDNTKRNIGPFRYYIVGEYGSNTRRPHYHVALFPGSSNQVAEFTGQWKRGFTSTYPMDTGHAQYLAKYTCKKLTQATDDRLIGDQQPEFRTSSYKPPLADGFVHVLVRAYSSSGAKKIIEERGDIERTWRLGRKVYPLPRNVLRKARIALGIPELHSERLAHPGYFSLHHDREVAEWNPKIAVIEEVRHHAKTQANALKTSAARL